MFRFENFETIDSLNGRERERERDDSSKIKASPCQDRSAGMYY